MPILSEIAKKKKITYFLKQIPKDAKILEIGCGDGWVGKYLKNNGYLNYTGLDIKPPADIVGNIIDYKNIGLKEESFDIIIGFEVIEHIDCIKECHTLLKTGGKLMLTSPRPYYDWISYILELFGLSQKRTSPHNNLINFKDIPYFEKEDIKIVYLLAQWGIFVKR